MNPEKKILHWSFTAEDRSTSRCAWAEMCKTKSRAATELMNPPLTGRALDPAKTRSRQENLGLEKPGRWKPRRTEQGPQNWEQSRCEERAMQGAWTNGQKTVERETNAGRDWKILQRGGREQTSWDLTCEPILMLLFVTSACVSGHDINLINIIFDLEFALSFMTITYDK
jgi:hypothetical protein